MKSNARSIRRHHKERIYNRAIEYMRQQYVTHNDEFTKDKLPDWLICQAHKATNTRTRCSCACCGNPRKHFGEVTRQEIIEQIRTDEQLKEI